MDRRDLRWLCLDCSGHTGWMGEYYTVHDDVWEASGGGTGMLCLGCLAGRLGRPLRPEDFSSTPVNGPDPWRSSKPWSGFRSERLEALLLTTV